MINEILNIFNFNQTVIDHDTHYYLCTDTGITKLEDKETYKKEVNNFKDFLDNPFYKILDGIDEEIPVSELLFIHELPSKIKNKTSKEDILKTFKTDLFKIQQFPYEQKITDTIIKKSYCNYAKDLHNQYLGNIPTEYLKLLDDAEYRKTCINKYLPTMLEHSVKFKYLRDNIDVILYHVFLCSKVREMNTINAVNVYEYISVNDSSIQAILTKFKYDTQKSMNFILSEITCKSNTGESITSYPLYKLDDIDYIGKLLSKLRKKDL